MKIHNRRGGFTLIELMIVVAIIGILAAIAIPNFLKFQLKAKTSEGKTNIAAIRTAEESVYAEFGSYVSSSVSPATSGQSVKQAFVNKDGANAGFDLVGWSPEGRVYFNYGVEIGTAEFTASASADIDADGTYQLWGYKKGSQDGKAHPGSPNACAAADLTSSETVMACATANGRSIF